MARRARSSRRSRSSRSGSASRGIGTGFGMTEIGAPIASDGCNAAPTSRAAASRGTGRPGYEVRVVDEHDEAVPPGTRRASSIVRCRRAVVHERRLLQHAREDRRGLAQRLVPHRRRLQVIDEDGNYYFVDRIKDAIRRRGENISSFEVEALGQPAPGGAGVGGDRRAVRARRGRVKVCVVCTPDAELHRARAASSSSSPACRGS